VKFHWKVEVVDKPIYNSCVW